mmetsp:Transcript_12808/g.21674  ORF Transcript_12808/g.21674 Transcript_12808/m.21674 type:complete len:203 (-) Transcript_12808:1054-1662(-)
MCHDRKQIQAVISSYFIGFSLGIILLNMPEVLGRKKTMSILMALYLFFSQLTIYSPSLVWKAVGFFMQGFLHLKITLSYTHIFELIDDRSKQLCATTMNAFDASTLFTIGFCLKFVESDVVVVVETMNAIGSLAIILYLLFVPESPRWLMVNQRSKESIKVLNYIAWFNGSSYRIPEQAQFDVIAQVLKQNDTLDATRLGVL